MYLYYNIIMLINYLSIFEIETKNFTFYYNLQVSNLTNKDRYLPNFYFDLLSQFKLINVSLHYI